MEQLNSEKKEVLRKASKQNFETFISPESLIKLLVNYGKGRRSVERQGSESPHLINNFEVIL